ncbi:MAG TPA: SPOR domain-containing protein [Longimicrobiales bacterium]
MSQVGWPAAVAFDPGAEDLPASLEALAALPAQKLRSLLLVAGSEALASGWAARTAVAVAAGLSARGRRVVLMDLCLGAPELHEVLGVENLEGVADAFLFGAPLRRLVREPTGWPFAFVPAGAYVPDPTEILAHARWDSVLREQAASGLLPVALAPAEADGVEALARRMGAAVVLGAPGEAEAVMAALPAGCAVLATLRPAARAHAGVGESTEAPDPIAEIMAQVARQSGEAARKASLARQTLVPLALGALVVLAVFGGILAYQVLRDRAAEADGSLTGAGLTEAVTEPPPVVETEPLPRPIEMPIPYSVQIEAHEDPAAAAQRVAQLRQAEPGMEFYVAPANVAGTIYHRVLAGPAADLSSAQALMQRLVDAGYKAAAEAWSLLPTRWAFHIADFPTREAARERGDELAAQGIPTYVVEIPYEGGPSRYRLYAGAYRSPAEAEVLAGMLRRAGYSAELVERTGRPAS